MLGPRTEASTHDSDVLILGDELESCLTACVLGWHGLRVTLLRRSRGLLGGLSTRGGLSYMDLTPEFLPPMMASVLKESGLKRVALHAETASEVLARRLRAAKVKVVSGVRASVLLKTTHALPEIDALLDQASGERYRADFYMDSTPDASLARQAGIPARLGLGHVFGDSPHLNALGVSPLFRVEGLPYTTLEAAEASLRRRPDMSDLLKISMPWLTSDERQTLLERPTYAPDASDYLDILNNVIGVAYHHWRYGDTVAYGEAPFWIDGFNIARLPEGGLGFNGLITRLSLEEQVRYSEEGQPPNDAMQSEMQAFLAFLREITACPDLILHPASEVYIRQTYNIVSKTSLTARTLFKGGVPAKDSIGTFSYWLDFRGVHPWHAYPDLHPLPKPIFNVGLSAHCPKHDEQGLHRLAILGRSSGFSPLAQGACRIVQYNAIVGEALAHAIALGLANAQSPWDVSSEAIYSSQARLAMALGELNPPKAGGLCTLTEALAHSPLLQRDDRLA